MLLSALLNKTLIADNQTVGAIENVCWQKARCCLLKTSNNTFSADALAVGEKIVATNLQESQALPTLCIGKQVYDTDGKLLGNVSDAILTKTLKVKKLVLDNDSIILPSKIVANNDIVTIRADKPKRTKQQTLTKQNATKAEGKNGQPTSLDRSLPKAAFAENGATAEVIFPKRKSGDFSFLMGKTVDKNITNFLGELMIRQGETVTREIYLKARYFGKLTELCLHTK